MVSHALRSRLALGGAHDAPLRRRARARHPAHARASTGVRTDLATGEAPGKIPHELRRRVYADPTSGMTLPQVYYGTIDATALWVTLLGEARQWGLSDDRVAELLPQLRAAVGWLVHGSRPDDDGLMRYLDTTGTGLANQGWKDSGDSIRWRDGRIADAPIAWSEAQAYAVEALRTAAGLYRLLGGGRSRRGRGRGHRPGPAGPRPVLGVESGLEAATSRSPSTARGGPSTAPRLNMGHVLGTGPSPPRRRGRSPTRCSVTSCSTTSASARSVPATAASSPSATTRARSGRTTPRSPRGTSRVRASPRTRPPGRGARSSPRVRRSTTGGPSSTPADRSADARRAALLPPAGWSAAARRGTRHRPGSGSWPTSRTTGSCYDRGVRRPSGLSGYADCVGREGRSASCWPRTARWRSPGCRPRSPSRPTSPSPATRPSTEHGHGLFRGHPTERRMPGGAPEVPPGIRAWCGVGVPVPPRSS